MRSATLALLVAALVATAVADPQGYGFGPGPPVPAAPNPVTTSAAPAASSASSGSGSTSPGSAAVSIPLLPFEKYIVAHGLLSMTGYLVILPTGAIVARWLRTFSPFWFKLHWFIQLGLGLPVIVAAFACGIKAVMLQGLMGLSDPHMKWGIAIFVLYLSQLSLGTIIHYLKPRSRALKIRGRPLQNYLHATFGLFIIGIAFYQVRTGFRVEWPTYTGRGKIPNGANIAWIVWLVLVCVFYFGGLLLLRRQYRQEAANATSFRKVERETSAEQLT